MAERSADSILRGLNKGQRVAFLEGASLFSYIGGSQRGFAFYLAVVPSLTGSEALHYTISPVRLAIKPLKPPTQTIILLPDLLQAIIKVLGIVCFIN